MKIIIIVLDGVGVGALPDAEKYNDTGANTLGNIAKSIKNFDLPNLAKLGLYNLLLPTLPLYHSTTDLIGSYGKMAEASNGKDTPIGHWEITGVITENPMPTYPQGFPKDLIEKFEKAIGTKTLGNYPCSGTEIIKQLGEQHYKTGYPIVYTSADSVFQIAAHEDPKIFGLERLYKICEIARKMLVYPHNVGRVIARPFIGTPGNFKRTSNRRDYSIEPPEETLLDKIKKSGGEVIAIGKIEDIFAGRGITKAVHTVDNKDGMKKTLEVVQSSDSRYTMRNFELRTLRNSELRTLNYELIFANLVDFDMLWGHRRDVEAYYNGLKDFDNFLPELQNTMSEEDILFITADHGCDPTHKKHTDHTREYVPLLVYGKKLKSGINLGVRNTFADLGQTIADFLGLSPLKNGKSFKKEIL
ncbi:MAG: phosphopentomutase [Endomicrobiia bacterium]